MIKSEYARVVCVFFAAQRRLGFVRSRVASWQHALYLQIADMATELANYPVWRFHSETSERALDHD
jgi:hypothetical protein